MTEERNEDHNRIIEGQPDTGSSQLSNIDKPWTDRSIFLMGGFWGVVVTFLGLIILYVVIPPYIPQLNDDLLEISLAAFCICTTPIGFIVGGLGAHLAIGLLTKTRRAIGTEEATLYGGILGGLLVVLGLLIYMMLRKGGAQ